MHTYYNKPYILTHNNTGIKTTYYTRIHILTNIFCILNITHIQIYIPNTIKYTYINKFLFLFPEKYPFISYEQLLQ